MTPFDLMIGEGIEDRAARDTITVLNGMRGAIYALIEGTATVNRDEEGNPISVEWPNNSGIKGDYATFYLVDPKE